MLNRSDSLISNAEQKERISLFVSCRNLDDLDFISVTDSFLVIKLIQNNKPEKVILKTKVYWNDLNPNYAETVLIDFYFEIRQLLIFQVYHFSNPPKLVGKMESTVGQIFGSQNHGLVKDLINISKKKAGKIIVRSEKQEKTQKRIISLKLSGLNLPNITWWYFFGGTNAFYRIFRKRQEDELLVYESQVIASTNCHWRQFRMSLKRLASNDLNCDLELRVYNYSTSGAHDVIGIVNFKPSALKTGAQFDILNRLRNKIGTLNIDLYVLRVQYEFADFLQKGLQLALITCIDFTASNGIPNEKNSLHYTRNGPSKYQSALTEVTKILLDYDYDKLVPVYGFGAKVKHPLLNTQNKVHHCFPINCNNENPNLYQLDEILTAYHKILPYLTFSGPTKFTELLYIAIEEAKQFQQLGTHYMILFILTDGEIHDRQQVIDLLIQCNYLPISLIIVGIGNGDFNIMHELDDDNCQMMSSNGKHTQRDLVQFVQFSQFKDNGVALAREVLEELPRQVSEYFQLINKSPKDIAQIYNQTDVKKAEFMEYI